MTDSHFFIQFTPSVTTFFVWCLATESNITSDCKHKQVKWAKVPMKANHPASPLFCPLVDRRAWLGSSRVIERDGHASLGFAMISLPAFIWSLSPIHSLSLILLVAELKWQKKCVWFNEGGTIIRNARAAINVTRQFRKNRKAGFKGNVPCINGDVIHLVFVHKSGSTQEAPKRRWWIVNQLANKNGQMIYGRVYSTVSHSSSSKQQCWNGDKTKSERSVCRELPGPMRNYAVKIHSKHSWRPDVRR